MKRDQQSGAPALLNTSKYIVNRGLRTYCSNVQDLLDINDRLNMKHARTTPLVASFGDGLAIDHNNNRMPLFGKWRKAMTHQEMERLTNTRQCQDHDLDGEIPPIIWKLETLRHWNPIEPSILQDTIWENKTAMATWRGAFTGTAHHKTSDTNMTELEHCQENRRCRFVLNHAKSKLIDAGIDNTLGFISDTVNGVIITKERLSMAAIQGRKAIISFEGNDVASGLKWSLLSQSVVLMPRPTRTSWAMEELLEPWVHYIPMADDGSDAEEMVRWMIDNDEKAKQIAERSTLFMYDLLYHPDAERENREVSEEIVRRYQEWWL
jgi:Glycosyl transferase family 90